MTVMLTALSPITHPIREWERERGEGREGERERQGKEKEGARCTIVCSGRECEYNKLITRTSSQQLIVYCISELNIVCCGWTTFLATNRTMVCRPQMPWNLFVKYGSGWVMLQMIIEWPKTWLPLPGGYILHRYQRCHWGTSRGTFWEERQPITRGQLQTQSYTTENLETTTHAFARSQRRPLKHRVKMHAYKMEAGIKPLALAVWGNSITFNSNYTTFPFLTLCHVLLIFCIHFQKAWQ